MASLRTKSREFAMQMLFQWDMSQQDPAKLEAKFWRAAKAADTTRAFANRLFELVQAELALLDCGCFLFCLRERDCLTNDRQGNQQKGSKEQVGGFRAVHGSGSPQRRS